MSHLLIDRFRFDSFAPDSDEAGSNLLTRFGDSVYLFFMITPPELLVERAWKRGLEFGRYKAVDDTLAHAVEAYTGMPDVFFTWVRRSDKRIQFEFLDNSVRLGELPRTVAFGDNDSFNVLDVTGTLDIERYGRVDVDAHSAAVTVPGSGAAGAPAQCEISCAAASRGFARSTLRSRRAGASICASSAGKPVRVDREARRRLPMADPRHRQRCSECAAGSVRGRRRQQSMRARTGRSGTTHRPVGSHTLGAVGRGAQPRKSQ